MSLPGICPAYHEYDHNASFSSDVVPTGGPFGDAITRSSIAAEAIFDNWNATTCPYLKDIPVERDSGEPGPIIQYDLLTKMLNRSKKRLPEEVKRVFSTLLQVRIRYFACYDTYFIEQRNRNDLYAERWNLITKACLIRSNLESFGENALWINARALQRNDRECKETVERYGICGDGIARCAHEFLTAKTATIPHINQLIADHNQAARRFMAMKAQAMNGHAARYPNGNGPSQKQAEKTPTQTDLVAGFSGLKQELNTNAPPVAGTKRKRDEEAEGIEGKGDGKGKRVESGNGQACPSIMARQGEDSRDVVSEANYEARPTNLSLNLE